LSRIISILGVLLVLPLAVAAEDLTVGAESRLIWTDNLFSSVDEESDWSIRSQPYAVLVDREGGFTYDLRYTLGYEAYRNTSELTGFDHKVRANAEWRITSRTTVRVNDEFARFRSISRLNELADVEGGDTDFDTRAFRARFSRNRASLSAEHRLSSRHLVTALAHHSLYDFSDEERTDRNGMGASGGYRYSLSSRTQLGADVSWQRQENETLLADTEADFVNLSAVVSHVFDPSFRISVSAGPTWITRPDDQPLPPTIVAQVPSGDAPLGIATCPTLDDGARFLGQGCVPISDDAAVFPGAPDLSDFLRNPAVGVTAADLVASAFPGDVELMFDSPLPSPNSDATTYFANVSLFKEWQRWSIELSYRREPDNSVTTGVTSVGDIVSFRTKWEPTRKLTLTFRTTLTLREQEVEGLRFFRTLQPLVFSPSDFGDLAPGIPMDVVSAIAESQALRAVEFKRTDEFNTLRFVLNGRYRLTKRTSLLGSAFWVENQTKREGFPDIDTEALTLWMGFKYEFDPINL